MSLPLLRSLDVTCASCDAHLQHCHGTALVRDDATHLCSDDPDCRLEVDEHWFVSHDEE